jgi:hypothetical protein
MTKTLMIATTPTAKTCRKLLVSDLMASVYTAKPAGRQAPLFVPFGQDYFWTTEWQRGEAEALREIANGDVHRFVSGEAAVRWLLSDD